MNRFYIFVIFQVPPEGLAVITRVSQVQRQQHLKGCFLILNLINF